MTALAAVCVASLLLNVPRDLLYEEYRYLEIWGGFELTGWAALLTTPVHWAIFAFGAWAFWTDRRWIAPWAGWYILYVGASHLVWSVVSSQGSGWLWGCVYAVGIGAFGVLLLRAPAATSAGRGVGAQPA